MIKTKIIATLGPATAKTETIQALMDSGVDVFRLNFSHGTFQEHQNLLEMINQARSRHRHTAAVMGDLCGPKIRTSRIEPDGQPLQTGAEVTIRAADETGNAQAFGTNYEHFVRDVRVGQRILIDDGLLALKIVAKGQNQVTCQVLVGGPLHSRKGINLPETDISVPALTEYDWRCVDWAIEHRLDFLALSFVRTAEEIEQLKDRIRQRGSEIKVVSKVEKPQAVENLESIVLASDAVLVARGDLGVEMDLAEVPLIQKRITQMCRRLGKPAVVATQMLQSMIHNPTPTPAETNDVANAIMDFTDAVMLSGETAVGKYPLEAVRTIRRIAQVTETYLDQSNVPRPKFSTVEELALTAAMARSVAQIVDDIDAELVAVWSQTGSAARLLSKARIDVPVLALSSSELTCRQMALHYGVVPRCRPIPDDITQFTQTVEKLVLESKWCRVGDQIVLVAGRPLGAAGTTNAIMVHTVTGE
ncbi:pyruvate kinase [Planctomycetota bacterium]